MKRLDDLGDTEKEILKSLSKKGKNSDGLTTSDIRDILQVEGHPANLNDVRDSLKNLIDYGSVRGYVNENGKRAYHLSRGLGSGYRNQGKLMGRTNVFLDAYKFIQRIFGSVFVLVGLGLIILSNISLTGNLILNSVPSPGNAVFYIASVLTIVGITLMFLEAKK